MHYNGGPVPTAGRGEDNPPVKVTTGEGRGLVTKWSHYNIPRAQQSKKSASCHHPSSLHFPQTIYSHTSVTPVTSRHVAAIPSYICAVNSGPDTDRQYYDMGKMRGGTIRLDNERLSLPGNGSPQPWSPHMVIGSGWCQETHAMLRDITNIRIRVEMCDMMSWPVTFCVTAHISHARVALVVGVVVVVVASHECHICAVNEKMRDRSEDTGPLSHHTHGRSQHWWDARPGLITSEHGQGQGHLSRLSSQRSHSWIFICLGENKNGHSLRWRWRVTAEARRLSYPRKKTNVDIAPNS